MKTKVITGILLTLFLASMLPVVPVVAMGPGKAKSDNIIHVANYVIIVSNRGWRQWRTDIDRFAVVLFTEGMTEGAIQAHLDDGWNGPWTMPEGDPRYPYVSPYVGGDVEIIWRYHDIPAGKGE